MGQKAFVADGCGWLRTVVNGKAASSEHVSTPKLPEVSKNPPLRIGETDFAPAAVDSHCFLSIPRISNGLAKPL